MLAVASIVLTGLFTHPIARLFSSTDTSVHGSIASFLLWTGFCLFVVPAVAGIFTLGLAWVFSLLGIAPWMKYLISALIILPLLLVYYLGMICNWIGRQYGITPVMGGLAILFSYALSMAVSSGIIMVISSLTNGAGVSLF